MRSRTSCPPYARGSAGACSGDTVRLHRPHQQTPLDGSEASGAADACRGLGRIGRSDPLERIADAFHRDYVEDGTRTPEAAQGGGLFITLVRCFVIARPIQWAMRTCRKTELQRSPAWVTNPSAERRRRHRTSRSQNPPAPRGESSGGRSLRPGGQPFEFAQANDPTPKGQGRPADHPRPQALRQRWRLGHLQAPAG